LKIGAGRNAGDVFARAGVDAFRWIADGAALVEVGSDESGVAGLRGLHDRYPIVAVVVAIRLSRHVHIQRGRADNIRVRDGAGVYRQEKTSNTD
jgi:hypothetical protein